MFLFAPSCPTQLWRPRKADRKVLRAQGVPWQNSKCKGPLAGGLPTRRASSARALSGRWEAVLCLCPGALPHLADSFHSIWSPSCCSVSISVKRVGLGASSSSPRMSWSCSAAGDPARGAEYGPLSACGRQRAARPIEGKKQKASPNSVKPRPASG